MRKLKVVVSGSVLAMMLLAAPAFADIPPADACMQADEGKACDNAGDNADQPGVCQKDTCTRQTPDGMKMTYECYLCQPGGTTGDGGATSNGGSTATGGSQNTAGSTTDKDDDDDGGCSMSAAPSGGLAGLIAPLVAFGLAAARRRRSRH